MVTFNVDIEKHHKKSDGTYNVKIRVTQKRKPKYIATPIFVYEEDLTAKYKIKDQDILDQVNEKIKKYYGYIRDLGGKDDIMNVEEIYDYIIERQKDELTKGRIDFKEHVIRMVTKMEKENRKNTAKNYR